MNKMLEYCHTAISGKREYNIEINLFITAKFINAYNIFLKPNFNKYIF